MTRDDDRMALHLRTSSSLRQVIEVADAVLDRAMRAGVRDGVLAELMVRLSKAVADARECTGSWPSPPYVPEYLPPGVSEARARAASRDAIGVPFTRPDGAR